MKWTGGFMNEGFKSYQTKKKHVFHPKSYGQHEGYRDSQAVKVSFCDGIGFEREEKQKKAARVWSC